MKQDHIGQLIHEFQVFDYPIQGINFTIRLIGDNVIDFEPRMRLESVSLSIELGI